MRVRLESYEGLGLYIYVKDRVNGYRKHYVFAT